MYVQEVLEAILEIYFKISKPSQISLIVTEKNPNQPTCEPANQNSQKNQPQTSKTLRNESCWERCRKVRNLYSAEKSDPCHTQNESVVGKREYYLSPTPVLHVLADLCETKPLPVQRVGVHFPNFQEWNKVRKEQANLCRLVAQQKSVLAATLGFLQVPPRHDFTALSSDDVFSN